MRVRNVMSLLRGDVLRSTRSQAVLWLVLMPFGVTFLLQVVFAAAFDPKPRLCLLDRGSSAAAAHIEASDDLTVTRAGSLTELRETVRNHDADMGMVLERDFDMVLAEGGRPVIDITVSEESDPLNRAIILLVFMDVVRGLLDGQPPVVPVIAGSRSGGDVPLRDALVPGVVVMVLMISGIFIPAYLLVREKETGTLNALMVSPVMISEVLASKALLGYLMTLVLSAATLALNGTGPYRFPPLLLTVAVGTLVCNMIGLVYGILSRTVRTLYTMMKSLNVLLAAPIAFYFVSGLPAWPARLFPTYWFIDPLYSISLQDAGFSDVAGKLAVALAVAVALAAPVRYLGNRMVREQW